MPTQPTLKPIMVPYVLAVLITSFDATALADHNGEHRWNNPDGGLFVGGSFFPGGNWDPSGIPGAGDAAIFDIGDETYTVDFDSFVFEPPIGPPFTIDPPGELLQLTVGDDDVTFDLRRLNYRVSAEVIVGESAALFPIGSSDTGTLTLQNGGLRARSIVLGQSAATDPFFRPALASGTLNVGGADVDVSVTGNLDAELIVGNGGRGTLNITDGGRVSFNVVNDLPAVLGRAGTGTGTVNVEGTGSEWTQWPAMRIGDRGSGALNVSDGGEVVGPPGADAFIAFQSGSSGALALTGDGSLFSANHLYVGGTSEGSGGTGEVTIGNEATLQTEDRLHIWEGSSVTLDGGTLRSHSMRTDGSANFDWPSGTLELTASQLVVGPEGPANPLGDELIVNDARRLELTNASSLTVAGSGRVSLEGGSINTRALEVEDGGTFDWTAGRLRIRDGVSIDAEGPLGDDLTLGPDMHLEVPATLKVGDNGAGNVEVIDGGTAFAEEAWIGAGESTGSISVQGGGSIWQTRDRMIVGRGETGAVAISDGGVVESRGASVVGQQPEAEGTVTIDGGGSMWRIPGPLTPSTEPLKVGDAGRGTVTVTNNGTLAVEETPLWVGVSGQGEVNLSSGGVLLLENAPVVIGQEAQAAGAITSDGPETTWGTPDGITVARAGTGELNITGGSAVTSRFATVAEQAGSEGSVIVDGADSVWRVLQELAIPEGPDPLVIGGAGTATVDLTGGGTVAVEATSPVILGRDTGSRGSVTVDGDDSALSLAGKLSVGRDGEGELLVSSGGAASNADATIGGDGSGTGSVTIRGDGSVWTVDGTLRVRTDGPDISDLATVSVEQGGAVASTHARIGRGGLVRVDGEDSAWSNAQSMWISGDLPAPSDPEPLPPPHLEITGGGAVATSSSQVGMDAGSAGTVLVEGDGSAWTHEGSMMIGASGAGELRVAGGGNVSNNDFAYIGNAAGQGTVTVEGAGSTWNNTGLVRLGNGPDSSGLLTIRDAGTVRNIDATIAAASDSNGEVTVLGEGSTWTSEGTLTVGGAGAGTLNIVDGGRVDLAPPPLDLTSFAAVEGVTFNGDAQQIGEEIFLTESQQFQVGSIYFQTPQDISGGFEASFTFRFDDPAADGDLDPGGDGMALVIQNGPEGTEELRLAGNALGYFDDWANEAAIPNSIAVVLDAYTVSTLSVALADGDGAVTHIPGPNTEQGVDLGGAEFFNEPASHEVQVSYDSASESLEIFFDEQLLLSTTVDLVDILGAGQGLVGFSAATGNSYQDQIIQSLRLVAPDGEGIGVAPVTVGDQAASTGVVNVEGPDWVWDLARSPLAIGANGSGSLTITAGGSVASGHAAIAAEAGATGDVTVREEDALWDVDGSLSVGGTLDAAGGTGQLTVGTGGIVEISDTLLIWDGGRVDLDGGTIRARTLDNSHGGIFNLISGTIDIGNITTGLTNDSGTIALNGQTMRLDGALVNNAAIEGNGTIDAPSLVNAGSIRTAGGDLVLDVPAGGLDLDGPEGTGVIHVDDGSVRIASDLAETLDFHGQINWGDPQHAFHMDHQGLTLLPAETRDGMELPAGHLNFAAGGSFRAERLVHMGRITVEHAARIEADTTLAAGSTTELAADLSLAGTAVVEAGAALSGDGSLVVTEDAALRSENQASLGIDLVNEGRLVPGMSPGWLHIAGDYTQTATGSLVVEIGGTDNSEPASPEFDVVQVDGSAVLDGALDVSLVDLGDGPFAPSDGDTFEILAAAGGVDGTFAATDLPALNGSLGWNVNYGANAVTLEVLAALLAGDYNANGLVEQADLDLVLANWGADGTVPPDDWVNDLPQGIIDQTELDRVLVNWGNTSPASGAAGVPEPRTALLLLVALVACAALMRRS